MLFTATSTASRTPMALAVVATLLLGGCGGGGRAPAAAPQVLSAQAASIVSPDIVGDGAILWDVYNGVARADSVLPPRVPTGWSFTHPRDPSLAFSYHAGWAAEALTQDRGGNGVEVLRDDGEALWRHHEFVAQTTPRAEYVRDGELKEVLASLGQDDAPIDVLAARAFTGHAGGGDRFSSSTIMANTGTHTVVVHATVTSFPPSGGPFGGLGTAHVRLKVCYAPTSEFDARAIDTFLAIDWQLRVTDDATFFDRDGDGWHDGVDRAPTDPSVN